MVSRLFRVHRHIPFNMKQGDIYRDSSGRSFRVVKIKSILFTSETTMEVIGVCKPL
ncbi:hypothetical protein [Metabacillus iocasae]|uniref:Uncharacterized protein n=1 Tax=Priestia iocasae TaxID=2291674 RepID=A0ABS2QPD0_9BACI|nr:hypothetical protein [Metabacillus iocasae]MBM7701308.1 hypothetical protein [Metabacillus iocasae]